MKKQNLGLALVGVTTLASQGASAAVPAEVTTMMTTMGADVATVMTAAVAIFVAVRGGVSIFRVVKKFVGAAGA